MLAVAANDGGYAASLQTLTPYVPPNEGNPGVYVPPSNRPAMTPTWGTVQPIGISSVTLAAPRGDDPRRLRGDQPRPYLASLRPAGTADGMPGLRHRLTEQYRERLQRGGFRPGERRRSAGRAVLERSGRYAAAAGPLAADRRHHCHPGGTRPAGHRARDSHGRSRATRRGHRRLGDQISGRCMAARDCHPV